MKRVIITSPGGWDKLELEELPIPKPGKGEVLVKTRAAGVNFADVAVRMGLYASAKKYVGWPITPGFEFSGTVVAFGEDNDDISYEEEFAKKNIQLNSEVFGVTRFFAYSTHVVVPKHQLYKIPKGFSFEEAAGFPAVFLTAYYAMFELAHPRKDDILLIHSAAGGVGSALVQLAKAKNIRVVAVVGSSHKIAMVKQLGADFVIDKSKEDLWAKCEEYAPEGFNAVFDANGVSTLSQSYQHLASGGKLVVYGFHSMLSKTGTPNYFKLAWDWLWTPRFNPLNMTGDNKSVMAFNLSYLFHKTDQFIGIMQDLLKLIEEGKVKPPRTTTYLMEEVAEAHKAIEGGNTIGKLVLLNNHADKDE